MPDGCCLLSYNNSFDSAVPTRLELLEMEEFYFAAQGQLYMMQTRLQLFNLAFGIPPMSDSPLSPTSISISSYGSEVSLTSEEFCKNIRDTLKNHTPENDICLVH